jgi:uncharacterized membrane protein YbhN (UPF0104 family)
MTARARRVAIGAAGVLLGALALAFTFVRFGWQGGPTAALRFSGADLGSALARTDGWWLVAALAANGASIPLRGVQLQALARRADGSAPRLWPCVRAVAVGVLAHHLLPARLGEAARAIVLTRDGAIALPRSAAALLVGRALDLLALLAVSALLPIALGLEASRLPLVHALVRTGALIALLLALVIAALGLGRAPVARAFGRLSPAVGRFAGELGDGLAALSEPKRVAVALAASLAVPLALAASHALALRALAIDAPPGTALCLTGVTLLGVAIPSAPSSAGVYHALVLLTLGALGVPPAAAVAFALVTHAGTSALNIAIGALALGRARLLAS